MKLTGQIMAFAIVATLNVYAGFGKAAEQKDIVDTAVEAGTFQTLAAALGAADLVDALKGDGPFTVFAPTDAAFAKLPEGTVDSLLKPENKAKLAAILKYHVVAGRISSDDAVKAGNAATLQGQSVTISVKNGQAMVNNAKLVAVDINASNGVIHVIDSVLIPSDKKKVSAAEARKMIEHAVGQGVKLYNTGHHEACAKIYMTTAREMVEYGDQMPPLVMSGLQAALAHAEATDCPMQRSWTLRHGLDRAYYAMRGLNHH